MRLATVAALALGTVAGSGPSAALELSPLTIMLDAEQPVGVLKLRNDGVQPAAFQITGLEWSQEGGEDIHAASPDLIVTPPIVSLEPGDSVLVRVGFLSRADDGGREGDYRLLLRDISQIEQTGSPLKVRTQVLLPVFFAPDAITHDVVVEKAAGEDGEACVEVRNEGNVHKKLVSIGPRGNSDALPVHHYVLAGATAKVCPLALEGELAGEALRAGLTSAYSNKVEFHDIPIPVAATPPGATR